MRRTSKAAPGSPSRRSRADHAAGVILEESLDLNAATRLRESLLTMRGADLVIDASNVHYLGTSCAQVLAAAVNTWQAEGRALAIASASEPFQRGVELLGLNSHFNPGAPSA